MTSVSQEYWQIFLAQGVCQGIGNGLIYTPTVSLVSTYFSKRRAMAMAITSGGGATGGIVFPLVAQQLLPKVGFAWTVRVMAFIMLANASIVICLMRGRVAPRKSGPIVEWSAFRELPYLLFCIGCFLILWSVYLAYSYVGCPLRKPSSKYLLTPDLLDQHFQSRYHRNFSLYIPNHPTYYECRWHPRACYSCFCR